MTFEQSYWLTEMKAQNPWQWTSSHPTMSRERLQRAAKKQYPEPLTAPMGAGVGSPGGDDHLRAGEADILGFPGVRWLQPMPVLWGPHTRATCILPVGSEGAVLPPRTGGAQWL